MVLDVGLGLEQRQRLHHEALDQLDSPVLAQRQDLLVGEQVSGSLHMTQPLSPRVLEQNAPETVRWGRDHVRDSSTRRSSFVRRRSPPILARVAIPIALRAARAAPRSACCWSWSSTFRPSLDSHASAMPSGQSAIMGEGAASRRATSVGVGARPRSRDQWRPLPPHSAFAPSVAFGLGLRALAAGPAHFLTVLLIEAPM